jgi:hypothetical protein
VRLTEVGTPVTATDGENAELGDDDGSADSGSDFLGGLDSETDVALRVTDDNDGLETGTLTGTGLLLDGFDLRTVSPCSWFICTFPILAHARIFPTAKVVQSKPCVACAMSESVRVENSLPYLHNLILELGQEEVDNLVLLDGQGVQVDLLHAGDLAGLDETAELGDGLPLLLLLLSTTTTATTTTATATVTTTVAARAKSSTSTGSSVSHFEL